MSDTEAPYDNAEAQYLRDMGESVVGCWFCLFYKKPKPYWPEEMTAIRLGEHVIRCPEHMDSR